METDVHLCLCWLWTIVTMFTCCSGYVNAPKVFCTADVC